jgi:F0F1-type ATP synthase epsilon subunit
MKISILDATHTIFEGVVSEAVLPGVDGELAILDDHEPIFVALAKGNIYLDTLAKKRAFRLGPVQEGVTPEGIKPIGIERGLARMRNNDLVILVEQKK